MKVTDDIVNATWNSVWSHRASAESIWIISKIFEKYVYSPIMSMYMEQSQYYWVILWTYSKYCLDVLILVQF
jgi:hypothetical protein